MVRIRNLLFLSIVFFTFSLQAQRIRKNHQEMTPSEKRTYRDAVIAQRAALVGRAQHHSTHFESEIHTRGNPINGTQFLPWHRMFMIDCEQLLRSSGIANSDKITIPYWDWRIENNMSNITWDDSGFLDLATLNNNSFNLTRGSMTNSSNLATNSEVTNLLNLSSNLPSSFLSQSTSSSFFSKRLESWHDGGHNFIGGTMGSGTSPRDPVFYLHHNFVDKLWQDWEDKESAVKSSFANAVEPFASHYPLTLINSIVDSRKIPYLISGGIQDIDVWFASNKKLLLDGLTGDYDLGQLGNLPKRTYCYVAWNGSSVEGTIYAGDVQRDANDNVIADNKGGFIVGGAGADFFAGKSIELRPGFSTVFGSPFSAQIVTTPCGYTTNALTSQQQQEDVAFLKAPNTNSNSATGSFKVYSNPVADVLNVEYNVEEDTPLSIELVNTLGQTVWQQNYGNQSKGVFNATIPTQTMLKGLYHVVIHSDKNQVMTKIIK